MSLLPLLLCLGLCGAVWSAAVKSGSAYSDVTIAIHKDIGEDPVLLANIKEQFSKASKVLYDATGGAAYYKDIVIAVPRTWTPAAYPKIHNDPYQKAEFRIAGPNGKFLDRPYTLQPGGCGEPGEYVHLTPGFLEDKFQVTTRMYGPPERLIIHEWAHLRYGIFDEYGIPGDPKFPLFYKDDGFVRVSMCSKEIKGYMESTEGPICSMYKDQVSEDCVFIPDMSDDKTRASIMALPYMTSVDKFCTDDDSLLTSHNWRSPTKQNLLCHRRSVWEVISKHADFSVERNSGEAYRPPNFRVVRVENLPPRYVFVLDVSGSMDGQPLLMMKQSSRYFVKDLVKDGSYVGVVTFESTASLIQPVTVINGPGIRATIQGQIESMRADGGTSVGSGIVAALLALRTAGLPTEDAVLIVTTDGDEGSRPFIGDTIADVKAAKVKVLAIALGKSASLDLERLARETGGKSVLIPNIHGVSTADLDQVFREATTTQTDTDVDIIQLLKKTFTLTTDVTETTVTLDLELGKNTVFTLTGQIVQVDMELISPSGKRFLISDSVASRDVARIQFKFPTAESGTWRVVFRKKISGIVIVDFGAVTEVRMAGLEPVRIKAWISSSTVEFGKTELKLFAQVTKGSDAVIRAVVKALIISDMERNIEVTLRDDGAGADVIADDGIYTAYFTDYRKEERRYTVTAIVENHGSAFIKSAKLSGSPMLARRSTRIAPTGPPTNKFEITEFQILEIDPNEGRIVGNKSNDFTRIENIGTFVVINFRVEDIIKPSTVHDLAVRGTGETDGGRKFIILTWTAPGDDLDSGTPARLEIRVSVDGSRFVRDFSIGILIDHTHVKEGSLTPQTGGTRQTVTIYVPNQILEIVSDKTSLDIYISGRAIDKSGNVGDVGNIVSAHFGYDSPICPLPTGQFPKARTCTQFYHCSNGEPYVKDCPADLHYSRERMRCEWQCSAKCDSRLVC